MAIPVSPRPAPSAPIHHFTVDVEEYYQVSAFEPYVRREEWGAIESRVWVGTDRLLDLLESFGYKATFFVLGCVADRSPDVVKSIAHGGHEVASHGWGHRRVTTMSPDDFREDVRTSKALLEDLTGASVLGYRAPSYSIVPGREWALDVILEEGYGYDSSLFPIQRSGYGYPEALREPHWIERASGRLYEIPPATVRRFGKTLPGGGGGYFRLLPYALTRAALKDAERMGAPGTFYIHPWELDPDQPRLGVGLKTRIRHYGGLGRVSRRLNRLLREFQFTSIASQLPAASEPVKPRS